MRVHTGPYGPIFVARGEKSQVKKVKINISDRDFFLGLFQGDTGNHSIDFTKSPQISGCCKGPPWPEALLGNYLREVICLGTYLSEVTCAKYRHIAKYIEIC